MTKLYSGPNDEDEFPANVDPDKDSELPEESFEDDDEEDLEELTSQNSSDEPVDDES